MKKVFIFALSSCALFLSAATVTVDPAKAVKKAILRMDMKMNKTHLGHTSLYERFL